MPQRPIAAPVARVKQSGPIRRIPVRGGKGGNAGGPAGYVRVRGLPFDATPDDVCDAFQNFRVSPNNVFMGLTNRGPKAGKPDGQCYVKLPARQVDQAVEQLNGVTIGSRYLELFASDEEDFNTTWDEGRIDGSTPAPAPVPSRQPISAPRLSKGVGKGRSGGSQSIIAAPVRAIRAPRQKTVGKKKLPPASDKDGVLRVRGLPFSCTPTDVVDAFSAYGIDETCVYMGLTAGGARAGQPDGQAYVRFASAAAAKDAEVANQGMTLGSRYLELYQSSEEDLQYQLERGAAADNGCGEFSDAGFVRLRGLPYRASPMDIVDFFGPSYGLTEDDVFMRYGNDGRPSGECVVQLNSEESAIAAQQSLDRMTLGDRYVEIFLANASEASRGRPGPY